MLTFYDKIKQPTLSISKRKPQMEQVVFVLSIWFSFLYICFFYVINLKNFWFYNSWKPNIQSVDSKLQLDRTKIQLETLLFLVPTLQKQHLSADKRLFCQKKGTCSCLKWLRLYISSAACWKLRKMAILSGCLDLRTNEMNTFDRNSPQTFVGQK